MNKANTSKPSLEFAGLIFKGLHVADLFPQSGVFKFVITVNADFIVTSFQSERFANLISTNLATIDGQITLWLARFFGKSQKVNFEKISGSSFAYDLLQYAAEKQLRVFFLGASPAVNKLATHTAKARYGIDVIGFSPPLTAYPIAATWSEEVLTHVKEHSPHILFVALGAPKQEYWIEDNAQALKDAGVQVAIGCGGTLDFLAGAITRAPVWIQKIGLEGLYRLAMQPSWFRVKRLARSFLIFPIVFWKAFLTRDI